MTNQENKLEEILQEFDITLGDSATEVAAKNWEMNDAIRDFIKRACIEYARSIVPERIENDYSREDEYSREMCESMDGGYNECRRDILFRIDKDSTSLTPTE